MVEPTAVVAIAIQKWPAAGQAYRRAIDWLCQGQHEDGGWGINHQDRESGWQTAWAVLALARAGVSEAATRGSDWLLNLKTYSLDSDDLQRGFRQTYNIDSTLRGWPWLPNEVTWIEPTALTMVALSAMPSTPLIRERLDEAVRYIQDRRCVGGGWNVGVPFMLGAVMPARVTPTAWVLWALAACAPEAIRAEDVAALQTEMRREDGVLAWAWGLVALDAAGHEFPEAQARLAARQQPDGSWNHNPYHTAVAQLALRGYG